MKTMAISSVQNRTVTRRWFNRNIFGFGLTSLLSDFCHEMATAVLPQFMQTIGASAASLGFIEGTADAISSFTKLGAGYYGDKFGHRKFWSVIGYALTAVATSILAFAFVWPVILLGRAAGWLGRGIRGPLRDAMLAESVAPEDRGKAFGFHRAGDSTGAVLGPLTAFGILTWMSGNASIVEKVNSWLPRGAAAQGGIFRFIFLLTLIPGILSVLSMAFLTTEKYHPVNHEMQLITTLRSLPRDYRKFLVAVWLFGIADFAPTLMILRASTVLSARFGLLEASRYASLFYLLRNVVYALASYPLGAFSDRFCKTRFLAAGYVVAVMTFVGFAVALPTIWWFLLLFCLAGIFIAWEDTVERATVRDYVRESIAGTAFGALSTVNGIGDFASSLIVGMIWTGIGAAWGFTYAAIIAAAGSILMYMAPAAHRQA